MRRWSTGMLVLMSCFACHSLAQAPAAGATTPISPDAAYDQAIAPVEITHRSVSNWSNTETSALAVAVGQAKAACVARSAVPYAGDDLIGYARLCALGQQWPTVVSASGAYLASKSTDPFQQTQAYAYLVEGSLHLNDEPAALKHALDMLGNVPYSPVVDSVLHEALRYMQLAYTADALVLAGVQQTTVLRLLHDQSTPTSAVALANPAPTPAGAVAPQQTVPTQALYKDGLAFAALQQYDGQADAAQGAVRELDAALPQQLAPDDAEPIAVARRQYALLGKPLPEIPAAASLFSPTETPRLNRNFGTSTVLLLYPPWCAQCVRSGKQILPALIRLNSEGADVHIVGLLADDPPPVAAPGASAESRSRKGRAASGTAEAATAPQSAADLLRGTPTLVVAPVTLARFGADDFPFVIATDHAGIVRLLLAGAPENALVPGSTVDQIAAHIARQWPVPGAK